MKPPPFGYAAPSSLEEALAVLAELGHDAKVLAGGQSLIPLLSMRLTAPHTLVDINRIPGLADISVTADGSVVVGALVRHAELLADESARSAHPLLRRATGQVAHPAIRNRGTTCGSVAHADPSGEMTAILAITGGSVQVASAGGGHRDVSAADFFLGPLESSLRPDELALSVRFGAPGERTGSAFLELSRRRGDYAMCGAAVLVTLDEDAAVSDVRAAYLSVGPVPEVHDLSAAVAGQPYASADWVAAGALAASLVEPEGDLHASADYRRRLVAVLTERALPRAAADAVARTQRAASCH
ncbi:MAG: xanthine dehydrogenase family protein subunit M [Geodermatophilaceae bacterium]|nr:xanthine dehydrogenase family protein subunit M [Geodermatophilaceae bacterium]